MRENQGKNKMFKNFLKMFKNFFKLKCVKALYDKNYKAQILCRATF